MAEARTNEKEPKSLKISPTMVCWAILYNNRNLHDWFDSIRLYYSMIRFIQSYICTFVQSYIRGTWLLGRSLLTVLLYVRRMYYWLPVQVVLTKKYSQNNILYGTVVDKIILLQ